MRKAKGVSRDPATWTPDKVSRETFAFLSKTQLETRVLGTNLKLGID